MLIFSRLILLKNGNLRHYIDHHAEVSAALGDRNYNKMGSLHDLMLDEEERDEPFFYDYEPGQYCIDKVLLKIIILLIVQFTNKISFRYSIILQILQMKLVSLPKSVLPKPLIVGQMLIF